MQDIYDQKSFSLITEKGLLLENLKEKYLQTVLPKKNSRVLILKEPLRGLEGTLIERDKKKD